MTTQAHPRRMLAVIILALGTLIGGLVEPLTMAHWDSPIYLYQAKRFAETDLLHSYSLHAADIGAQVSDRSWPESESYSEAFWRFMRLGNIAILGSLVTLAGDPMLAISLAGWVYAFLVAAATALTFLAVLHLGTIFGVPNEKAFTTAAVASALLYFLSPIYWYLSANFLSEIPARFLLSATLLVFLRAMLVRSVGFGALAGLLVFLLYSVRMDSAWTVIAILAPLIIAIKVKAPQYLSYRVISATVLTVLVALAAYSFLFPSLTDPRVVLSLRKVLAEGSRGNGVAGYHAAFVAGGLLWVGATWALLARRLSTLTVVGIVWLVLILVPRVHGLAETLQTRILADLAVPLALLSTVGLSAISPPQSEGRSLVLKRGLTAAVMVVALSVSLQVTYDWLRTLPGGWRLHYLRAFLVPPRYERNEYPIEDLRRIAATIYEGDRKTVVLWDAAIPQEWLNIVRYFGPPYPSTADLAMEPDPTNRRTCGLEHLTRRWELEHAIFCSSVDKDFLEQAEFMGKQLILLLPTKLQADATLGPNALEYVFEELATTNQVRAVTLVRNRNSRNVSNDGHRSKLPGF